MMNVDLTLSAWVMKLCGAVVPKLIIRRKYIKNSNDECSYSESVESYICSNVLVMKDKKGGKFSTGVITVGNIKFVNATVNTLRISIPLESTMSNLLDGALTVYLQNIRTIMLPNQKSPIHVGSVDHVKIHKKLDKDTDVIVLYRIRQFINMHTGEVCGPDGYPIPEKTKSDS